MRIVVVLCLALAVAGCGFYRLPPCGVCKQEPDASFTAEEKQGLLVFGVVLKPDALPIERVSGGEVRWLVEKSPESFPAYFAIPIPKELLPGRRVQVAWRVPPGVWSLRQLHWHEDKEDLSTPPFGGRAAATTVVAGEVTYAGDLVLDGDKTPPEITVVDDQRAARTGLGSYAGVTVPIIPRVLTNLREPGRKK